ncbi:MAG: hypothetical protein JWO74_634 [Solirubrobacterales bacterium]|nr:hypothetical protein [Solirubrobacterales bacterium]
MSRHRRRRAWPALALLAAGGTAALPSAAAPAATGTSPSITQATAATPALRAGTFTVRATRLSARRVRVTMELRVRARHATQATLVAYPCKRRSDGTDICSTSAAQRSALVTLHTGANRLVRSYIVRYPGAARTSCGAGEALEQHQDGSTRSLVRNAGTGTALKRCPA